jgi:hypothetical protein
MAFSCFLRLVEIGFPDEWNQQEPFANRKVLYLRASWIFLSTPRIKSSDALRYELADQSAKASFFTTTASPTLHRTL